jgi:beta-glucosidase
MGSPTKITVCAMAISAAFAVNAAPAKSGKATDAKMNAFITKLMSKMTLEEKIGQLNQYTADMAITGSTLNANYKEDIK